MFGFARMYVNEELVMANVLHLMNNGFMQVTYL